MCRSISQNCPTRTTRRCPSGAYADFTQEQKNAVNERRRSNYAEAKQQVASEKLWLQEDVDEREAARAITELSAPRERFEAAMEWLFVTPAGKTLVEYAIPQNYRNAALAWTGGDYTEAKEDYLFEARLLIIKKMAEVFEAGKYDPNQAPPRHYINTIGAQITVDLIRSQNTDKRAAGLATNKITVDPGASVEEGGLPETVWGVSPSHNPEPNAINNVAAKTVRTIIGELPEGQRNVILASMAGETLKEHAEATGEPLSTVKSRFQAAKKAIAVALAETGITSSGDLFA